MQIDLNVLVTIEFFLCTIFYYFNLQFLFTYQKIQCFVDTIFKN